MAYMNWAPKVDLIYREKDYLIKVELSEVYPSDVSLSIHKNIITIEGHRHFDEELSTHQQIERDYGKFVRKIKIRQLIDPDEINAQFGDGILYIVLPKNKDNNTSKKIIDII